MYILLKRETEYYYIIYDTINKESTILCPTPQDCIYLIKSGNFTKITYDNIFSRNKNVNIITKVNSLDEFYQKNT